MCSKYRTRSTTTPKYTLTQRLVFPRINGPIVFVQNFVTLNSSQNSSKGGLTREMFFNTRREISCLYAAT